MNEDLYLKFFTIFRKCISFSSDRYHWSSIRGSGCTINYIIFPNKIKFCPGNLYSTVYSCITYDHEIIIIIITLQAIQFHCDSIPWNMCSVWNKIMDINNYGGCVHHFRGSTKGLCIFDLKFRLELFKIIFMFLLLKLC